VRAVEFSDDTIQLLLYGRSGTGKTTLWSTFPKPILGVICSGGQRSGELRSVSLEDRRHIQRRGPRVR
jgi:ABC-type lipoprotein export system ATPase subunit